MEACAWCMRPVFAVVVPVRCASSANGMAGPPRSRARSACCCIHLPLVQPRCGFAGLEPQRTPASLHAACATAMHRGQPVTSCRRFAAHRRRDPLSGAALALAPLMGRAVGSQCAPAHHWSRHDQALRHPRKPCGFARVGDDLTPHLPVQRFRRNDPKPELLWLSTMRTCPILSTERKVSWKSRSSSDILFLRVGERRLRRETILPAGTLLARGKG